MARGSGGRVNKRARVNRVLILHDALRNGGAERQLALLATHLPRSWRPTVWSARGGPFAEMLAASGIPVIQSSTGSLLSVRSILALVPFLLRSRPDVVHAWGAWSTVVGGVVCRLLGIPLIECSVRSAKGPSRRWLFRLNCLLASAVVGNSEAGLEAWAVPEGKRVLIRNGFDFSRLSAACRKAAPQEPPPVTAVMAARMVPGKDFRTLLEAARIVADARPGALRVLLLGEGPDRRLLETSFGDLVTAGVVEFLQPGVEAVDLVATCHIGVLLNDPAHAREGCSNSILEYMAAGLPVVCTAAGGNAELVEDGVTGRLVAPGDARAVAGHLLQLADSPGLLRRLGTNGRRVVEERFSVEKMVASTVALYERLTRGRAHVS